MQSIWLEVPPCSFCSLAAPQHLLALILILSYCIRSQSRQAIPANTLTPLIAIAPTLIILQVQSGLSTVKEKTATTNGYSFDSAVGQSMAYTLPVHSSHHSHISSVVVLPTNSFTPAPLTPPPPFLYKNHSNFVSPEDEPYLRPK